MATTVPAPPKRRSDPAAQAWRAIVELFRSQRSRFVALASEFELTPLQAHVLHLLDPEQPVAMSALAESLACDASNVTGIVDRLESRGLIERRGAERDRRVKMLVVTPRGVELRRLLEERLYQPPEALAALPKADQRALRDILRRATNEQS